ncbi:MAG: hypothetical protein AAFZ07_16180 [Actinomycetota bacterium]
MTSVRSDRSGTLEWLLDGDPAIRWQVLLHLLDASPAEVDAERGRVATEGWGAELLSLQDPDGRWAGALYSPKWTSTTYTLLHLVDLGVPGDHPAVRRGTDVLWDAARSFDGGLNLAKTVRAPEMCITGMLVRLAAESGIDDERVEAAVAWLLAQQLADGGWNCETVHAGSTHGSFHTSVIVLEGLLAYERAGRATPVAAALTQGRRFFLDHRLHRSHRTGEEVDPVFRRFPFPPRWHFDVVRGLEHFAEAGAEADERLAGAIEVVRRSRRRDGSWPKFADHPGRTWFAMEGRGPSRWSTLRARRVLRWWEGAGGR